MSVPFRLEVEKPLSQYSTLGIGGPARFFTEVTEVEQMQDVLIHCYRHKLPYIVIGKGSNCLFDDRGFDGLAILNKISFCRFDESIVSVGAGYSFSLLGTQTARRGWGGLEFASGIPGSVGGAIYMNAGASGAETQETLREVSYLNEEGGLEVLPRSAMTFSYRFSPFQRRKGAIVSAKFSLTACPAAREKQLGIIDYRTRTQPYQDKSAGCVFRNPLTCSAGALIQQAGLKGMRIGGAEVSTMHANFIVNKGEARATDVIQLCEHVKKVIKETTGQDLEMEICCIPYQLK